MKGSLLIFTILAVIASIILTTEAQTTCSESSSGVISSTCLSYQCRHCIKAPEAINLYCDLTNTITRNGTVEIQVGDTTTTIAEDATSLSATATANEKLLIIFPIGKEYNCVYSADEDATETSTDEEDTTTLLDDAIQKYEAGFCITAPRNNCDTTCEALDITDSYYAETIIGDYRLLVSNGIPNHAFSDDAPRPSDNIVCEHKLFMAVPLNPVKSETFTEFGLGRTGFAISGGFINSHFSSRNYELAVPISNRTFDSCNGHADGNCAYHYHMVPKCINDGVNCSFVGYMADGFPVYLFCENPNDPSIALRSCYYLNSGFSGHYSTDFTYDETAYANGECDLDRANGYDFTDGKGYAYVFTEDYPYTIPGSYSSSIASMCNLYDD